MGILSPYNVLFYQVHSYSYGLYICDRKYIL
jgi:hypothetical protein